MKNKILGILFIVAGIALFKLQPQIQQFLEPFDRSPVVLVLRDIIVASYAHIRAGDPVPFDLVYGVTDIDKTHIDYTRSLQVDPRLVWGTMGNSVWIADKVRLIVPFFSYEGIIETATYPNSVIISPYDDYKSIHILGNAGDSVVWINERMFLGNRPDIRLLYSTLIHELIHLQGGNFRGWIASINEPHTQAATLEILAAMCHYRDEIACYAFWDEIESFARGSLLMRLRMYGHEDWYDKIANLFWRDSKDKLARDKSMRFWDDDLETMQEYFAIINNYQKFPWEMLVVEGICSDGMKTGFQQLTEHSSPLNPEYEDSVMEMDDTRGLLGILSNMICALPHGGTVR